MAKNQGRINFGVGFNVDKSGLTSAFNNLKQQLQSLQNLTISDLGFTKSTKEAKDQLESLQKVAKQVETVLEHSFNKDLGTINIAKFNQALTTSGTNIKTVVDSLNNMGIAGKKAANTLTAELLTTNKHIRETSKWIDKMAETMSNTVRWSIASTALNSMTGAVQKAYGFTKQLDASLNDIMIVTDKSAEDMARFAKQANTAAKSLGAVTTDYTKASLIYYQQGLSDQEVAARTETTMKVANVTGQSADAVSEQLTAVWNGYKVNSQEAELYIDKLSAVAATTAADLEELSTGMSRVASAANIMGVDVDQLNAQLATIVSVTREAPESIGTALKTVYARMSDIEAGLDIETTLGEYTKQMAEMGINALDANGNLRDMGDVVEEIGDKWNTLNRNQQTALAQTIAGTRQYSRMMALFDNWNMYESAKSTSQGAAGTLQAQNEEYMESMEAHLNKLQTEAEELYQTLFDADSLKPLINGLTSIVGLVENIIESLGGGQGLIGVLGTIGLNVFGDKLTMGISRGIRNIKGEIDNLNEEKAQANLISQLEQDLAKSGIDTSEISKDTIEDIVNLKKEQLKVEKYLSEEQKQQANDLIKEKAELENQKIDLEKSHQRAAAIFKNITDKDATKLTGEQSSAELRNKQFTLDLKDDSKYYSQLATQWDTIQDLARQEKNVRNSKEYYNSKEDEYAAEAQQISKNWTGAQSSEAYDTAISKQATARARALEKAKQEEDLLLEKQVAIEEILDRNVTLFKDLSSQAKQLNDTGIFTDEDQKRLQQIVNQMKNLANVTDAEELSDTDIKHIAEALRDISIYGKKASDEIEKTAVTLENGEKAAADLEKKLQQLKDTNNKLVNSFKVEEVVSSFVNLAGSVRSVGEGITQLQRLGSIWSNDDLSTGEKVLQTVSSLSIALPMLVSGISGMGSALKGLSAARAAFTASLGMSTAMTIIDTKAQDAASDQAKENAFWMQVLIDCKDDLTEEQMQSILAYYAENEAIEDNTKAILKNIAAKKLADGQNVGDMKLNKKDLWKTFGDKLGGNIKNALTKAAPALIVAAFVAVAAAAVAGAYTFIDDWHKKEQKALAETKKLAKEAADNTKLLKESYDQLSSAVDKYTEITTSIDDMVAGTQEYRDAIHEANDELLKMIQQYPELSDQIVESTEHTGLLVLKTEDALENMLALESRKVNRAQAVEYGLQAQIMQAEQDLAIAKQAKEIKTSRQTGAEIGTGMTVSAPLAAAGAFGGAAAGMGIATAATAAGATVGSVVPIVGTIVGAIVGLAAGAVITVATASESIQSSNEDLMTRAAELYNENNALFSGTKDEVKAMLAKELDINDQALIDSLYDNKDAIKELSATIKASNLAEEQYRVQQADRYLSSLGIEHEYKSNVSKELKLTDDELKKYQEQAAQMTDKEVQQYYANAMGWTHVKDKWGGKGEFEYTDANGEIQNKIIDDKTIRAAVAEMMALESEIGAQAHGVIDAIDAVASTGVKAVDDQLANVVTQEELNLKNLTVAERKMFEAALKNLEMISIGTLNEMGVNSVNVLNSYAQESLRNLDEYLDKLATKYISNDRRREQYNSLFTDGGVFADSDLSVANREILAQLYGDLDTSSLTALTNIFSTLGEEAEDFIALLPSLSADGINAFKENLVLDTAFAELLLDPVFKTFITGVQDTFHLYGQFNKEEHQSNIGFLQDVASKLHNIGDEISAEDYARLPAELKTFFVETETGMYSLIARAYEFKDAVEETEQEKLFAQIRDTQAQLKEEETKLKNGSLMSTAEASYINNMIAAAKQVDYHGQNLVDAVYQGEGNVQYYEGVVDAMDKAEEMLGFLSTHQWAGQTAGNAVDMLRDAGYDVDYWYQQIQKGYNGFSKDMILDLAVLMDQYIEGYENILPDESEGDVQNNIENLNAQLQAQQESAAQQAGSLSAFENLIQQGLITDESIIDKYTDFYTNVIAKRFEESLDYSFELKPTEDAIESLTTELEKYEEAYSNAFGQGKVDLLEAQIPVLQNLNEQYKLQNDLLIQRAEFYKTSILNDKLNTVGLNVEALQFGADGSILNYNEIMNNAIHWAQQNSPDTEGELRIDELQAALDVYSNYINQIKDNNNLIQENLITEFDAKLQIELDTESATREFNQFLRDFENYGADLGKKTQVDLDQEDLISYQNEIASIQNQLAEVNQQEFDVETAYNKRMELHQQYEDKLREQKEYLISLEDKQIEKLDELNEIYEEQISYLDTIYDFNKQNLELQKLINGESSYNAEIYQNTISAREQQQAAAKEKLEEDISKIQAYAKSKTAEEELQGDKVFKQMIANYQQSLSNYQNTVIALIEEQNEAYLAGIENSFNTFEKELMALSNIESKNLADLKDEYDWTKKLNDYYLDDINKSYQQSTFYRNLDKAAIGASVKTQEKLNQLRQEEIEAWSKKDKLTQADLDRSNKRLDILKAQIALEEAQQNQSQMRLVRGADGTYGYEYVADQNKVLQAEEDLAAAQNELYNMDVNQYEANLERMYQMYEEYKTKMLELAQDEDGLTEADIASLQGYITEIENMATSSQIAFTNVSNTLNGDISQIVETMTSSLGSLATAIDAQGLDTALDGMLQDITGPDGLTQSWSAAMQAIRNELYGTDTTKGILAGIDAKTLGLVDEEGNPIIDINDILSLDVTKRQEEANNYVTNVTEVIEKGWESLTLDVQAYQKATTEALDLQQAVLFSEKGLWNETANYWNEGDVSFTKTGAIINEDVDKIVVDVKKSISSGKSTISKGLEVLSQLDTYQSLTHGKDNSVETLKEWSNNRRKEAFNNGLQWMSDYLNNQISPDTIATYGVGKLTQNVETGLLTEESYNDVINSLEQSVGSGANRIKGAVVAFKNYLESLDTGGYTGEWGPSGRIAMLHEKELVLNKTDTENILTAVDTMRSISNALNNNMLAALLDKLSAGASAMIAQETTKDMKIEQDVHIEAVFPNVSVASEVEEALNNIINEAAQELTRNTRG